METRNKRRYRSLYLLHILLIPLFLVTADILLDDAAVWIPAVSFLTGSLEVDVSGCLMTLLTIVSAKPDTASR